MFNIKKLIIKIVCIVTDIISWFCVGFLDWLYSEK